MESEKLWKWNSLDNDYEDFAERSQLDDDKVRRIFHLREGCVMNHISALPRRQQERLPTQAQTSPA